MSLENLYPHAGDHSIVNVALAIEWSPSLSLSDLERIRSLLKENLGEGWIEHKQHNVAVTFTPDNIQNSEQTLNGYTFTLNDASSDITNKQITITLQSFVFVESDYKRWQNLFSEYTQHLELLLNTSSIGDSLSVIGLQYTDKFLWKAASSTLNLMDIFKTNNKFIAENSLSCTEAWHSHHGYFDNSSGDINYKRLNNINVQVSDEEEDRAIYIMTSHRATDFFAHKGTMSNKEVIHNILNEQHSLNKQIIQSLLTDSALEKIKFNIN